MGLQRTIRTALSLLLALSVAVWAESVLAMLASHDPAQCHARMVHAPEQAHAMPCCPSHMASIPASYIVPPPCCDLSNQPSRPLTVAVVPSKFRPSQLGMESAAGAVFVSAQTGSALGLIANSPPFIRPVLDLKTDLRI